MDRAPASDAHPTPVAGTPAPPTPPPPPAPLRPRPGTRAAAWAAGLLLVVPAVVAGCKAYGTDGVTPVPQLLSFLPWLTVPAALGVLCAAAARHRPLAWLSVLVLMVTAWTTLPPLLVYPSGTPLARIRVIAANVEFGQATGSLVDLARRERPQLLYVSECDPRCVRTLTAALSGQLPHRASVDAEGSRGSVVLSAYPLSDRSAVPATMGMPGATARIAGRAVRLQLAHPMPPLPDQVGLWKAELARLRAEIASRPPGEPILLAGDFNASLDHAAYRSFLTTRALLDAAHVTGASRTPTWPAEGPLPPYVQIDHVLSSHTLTPVATRFLPLPGSDHRAVLADLDLHEGR